MKYILVALTAAAAALAGWAPAGASPAAGSAPAIVRAAPGTPLWAARVRGRFAKTMTVGPDGRRVYITAWVSAGRGSGQEYATAAFNAATGSQLWVSRYTGPRNGSVGLPSVVVGPGGRRVFVTAMARGWGAGYDYATVAYSANTGKQLWVSHYNGPANGLDRPSAIAVSPSGAAVFVTGTSPGLTGAANATVAYSAATGRQLWASRFDGGADLASLAVSPGGATVFVAGTSDGQTTPVGYVTLAYSIATGHQVWTSSYDGPGAGFDGADAVGVSPNGATVFVTGESLGLTPSGDYATVAYSAATGSQLWVARYDGPGQGFDAAQALAVGPGGTKVFVTGESAGLTSINYATVAYRAATGSQLWVSRFNGPGRGESACCVAVSPNGATVFVTGQDTTRSGADFATVAYGTGTGKQLWVSRYHDTDIVDEPSAEVVSPTGTTVFVTGDATIAYRA
jgi:hypothetical protein